MQKKPGKHYLKITLIALLVIVVVAFVVPNLILFGYRSYKLTHGDRTADHIEEYDEYEVEQRISAREKARNQGVLLDETPESLLSRKGVVYHDGDDLWDYCATEPIKVRSTEEEFKNFCIDYFGKASGVNFYFWAEESFRADYGEYTILRTELFNPEQSSSGLYCYYVEDVGMEGMTCSSLFFYDATGKYALVKYGDNDAAIAKFLGLTIEEKDEDYNPIANQRYEQARKALDEARSIGVILESAPEELTARSKDTFDGTDESVYMYYAASEPIKVSSDSAEFENFCRDFFFDHPEPITFYRSANETVSATCGDYVVNRTEYFNPTSKLGQLYYTVDGFEDGMSLTTDFVYDITGKYAMYWYNYDDNTKYVLAKFIGLNFGEEHPYVSPNSNELEKLSLRSAGKFNGDIWKYVAYDSVVRVQSDEEAFVQYCEELFKSLDAKIVYWPDRDGENAEARCGDYILLRTQYFDPIRYMEDLLYEGDITGDTEPMRSKFFYDCTGKYALVYMGDDSQDKLCVKFLGF